MRHYCQIELTYSNRRLPIQSRSKKVVNLSVAVWLRSMNRFGRLRYGAVIFSVMVVLAATQAGITCARAAAADTADVSGSDSAAAAATHRPLRMNEMPQMPPTPTTPEVFAGYVDAPPFEVVPRQDKLTFFPCTQCHLQMTPNPKPRQLVAAPHPAALKHGGGRMWCLDCHDQNDRSKLRTISDQQVSFNESYLVCGQCHATRQQDWYFGAHGKRVQNWQGDRTLYACTHCHNPHSPSIKPRQPSPPPPVRVGLQPMRDVERDVRTLWQQLTDEQTERQP